MGHHASEVSSWVQYEKEKEACTIEEIEISDMDFVEEELVDRRAPIEKLPVEIYDQIFSYLVPDETVKDYKPRNSDLSAVLKTSRTLYAAALFTIFQNAMFPHSPVYSKWLRQVTTYPVLGSLVRRMDYSQYTTIGIGRTGRMNRELQNLTASTLVQGLRVAHNLREFLAQEELGSDIDVAVLEELFFNLPQLEAVDFCGCSHSHFKQAFNEIRFPLGHQLPIQRLSLHECTTISASIFTSLLPCLPNLTHLDLSHTQVTDYALNSIPRTAKITHLSLSKCARLTGERVVEFLTNHPAVQNLKVLNLFYDASRYRLLSAIDVEDLLPVLPKSLISLNLSGASISSEHMLLILPLVSRLEELSLAHTELTAQDLNAIFLPQWRSNLKYLDITGIAAVTPNALLYDATALLKQPTMSTSTLQVLEMSEKIVTGLSRSQTTKRYGWTESSYGRRSALVRKAAATFVAADGKKPAGKVELEDDDGERSWKLGSKKWGNRKIPCNWGEVGGIYAYYGLGK